MAVLDGWGGSGAGELAGLGTDELAGLLVAGRADAAAAEARWLAALAEFDRRAGWAGQGMTSCVAWLVWRTKLARSTAHDKLRVAHELERRPLVRTRFAAGELSWCQVRAITRITGLGDEVDEALLEVAHAGRVDELEAAVRHARLIADQDRPPPDEQIDRRRFFRRPLGDGMARLILDVADEQADVVEASIRAALRNPSSIHTPGVDPVDSPVDGSSREDSREPRRGYQERRADALIDLVLAGRAHLDTSDDTGTDRFTANVVIDYERLDGAAGVAELMGSRDPLEPETLERILCDCGIVRHVVRGRSEVLDVGRRTRTWNRAQRRALRVLFGGQCAHPGCARRIIELHHLHHWTHGGETDIANGVPLCWYHHQLQHEGGWTTSGNPLEGTLTFIAPDGHTHPAQYPARYRPAA